MSENTLPRVTFDGVPARSVQRLADGTLLCEAPLDTRGYRVIDAWVRVHPERYDGTPDIGADVPGGGAV